MQPKLQPPESVIDEIQFELMIPIHAVLYELGERAKHHGRPHTAQLSERIASLFREGLPLIYRITAADVLAKLADACRARGDDEALRLVNGIVEDLKRGQTRVIKGRLAYTPVELVGRA